MSSDWIEIDPDVCNGRPVLRGTRIAVQSVLEMLAAGDSVEEVLQAFPSLGREQVLACVDHAARLMGNQYSLEHESAIATHKLVNVYRDRVEAVK